MSLKPFWRYYGGKWRAAPYYPPPRYDTIVEPFAGSAGYAMRYPDRRVILVEMYAVVAEMWRYLIGVSPEEIRRIPLVDAVDDLPSWCSQGARWLVGFAMNAATTHPCKVLSSGRKKLRAAGRVFEGWSEALRERIACQVDSIRHWRIIEGDFSAAPDIEASWFIDPPYSNRAGSRYAHAAEMDYERLAAWARSREGQVIVCENAGATWLPFRPFKKLKAGVNGQGSEEVVWIKEEDEKMKVEMDGKTYTPKEFEAIVEATPVAPPPALHEEVAAAGFTPTEGQSKAVDAVARLMKQTGAGLLAIVGFAGTGKTTMLKLLGAVYRNPLIITPTGKAALRVSEAAGLPARTAHRWLYKSSEDGKTGRLKFDRKQSHELEIPACRLVLIDEASMVGAELWADIWRVAKQFDLKVVAVGDGFQLPPVQDRNAPVFSLLDEKTIAAHNGTRVELTEVLRQAQDSPVVRASMMLRQGMGDRALGELPRIPRNDLPNVAVESTKAGGVIICHSNNCRFRVNEGMRMSIGIGNGPPQVGEPLLVLRNNYDLDLYNGEQVAFGGWTKEPTETQHVRDRYTGAEADIAYGCATVDGRQAVVALQELTGSVPEIGGLALSIGAEAWARQHGCWTGEKVTPFLQANYGYCYTAHKSQGSEWPYALVIVEPSVKLDREEGRRWAYTAVTRAKTMAAVFFGKI